MLLRLASRRHSPLGPGLTAFAVPLLLALCGVNALSALRPGGALLIEIALTGLAALFAALLALRLPAMLMRREAGRGMHDPVPTVAAGLADEASQPLNVATLWLRRARAARHALPATERETFEHSVLVIEDQLRRAGAIVGRIRDLAPPPAPPSSAPPPPSSPHSPPSSAGPACGASAVSQL
ncbi:hypothetical protein [Falsiroseomonas oryziterrae]|uniref:hypothetical protein n=1 Tax=Falsiroseomonas oryziterrae TaxID=2911368 RepID=UPI001F43E777|nr:hypothetical protein [Roseomonas sp. NPKOSM-4]